MTFSSITQYRERTNADRRSFVLSEQAESTAKQLLDQQKHLSEVSTPNVDFSATRNGSMDKARNRAILREAANLAVKKSFYRLLGETVFKALPLEESEKAPFRSIVLSQTAELAEAVAGISEDFSPVAENLLEAAQSIVNKNSDDVTSLENIEVLTTETLDTDDELNDLVAETGRTVEERTIEAIVATQKRTAELEEALSEAASGDAELDATVRRRIESTRVPTLLESLFVANHRSLHESGGEAIGQDIVMTEAVCQYVLVETFSALGLMNMSPGEVVTLAERIGSGSK